MKKSSFILLVVCLFGCSQFTEQNESYLTEISQNISIGFVKPNGVKSENPITKKIVECIEKQSTKYYLDICIYGLDEVEIITAVQKAIARGVHVRFVGNVDGNANLSKQEGDYYQAYYQIASSLDKYFPNDKLRTNATRYKKWEDFAIIKSKNGIMHNKFIVCTDENENKTLIVGSSNYTSSCLNLNYNDILFITDNNIATKYSHQIEYLLGQRSSPENTETFFVGQTKFVVSFSHPNSKSTYIMDQIVDVVNESENSIKFMAFSFTHTLLYDVLIQKSENGVSIEGVYDKSQLQYSKEELFDITDITYKIDGNEFIQDNHGGKLHNKCMIIDEQIVVTGSFNWSKNADVQNQENILFIYSSEIAKHYLDYYKYIKKNAK